jgi:hypothetical protein
MKYRFNRGLRSNLSFYRDSGGNEVDLIMEMGPDIFPVEIKAAETITPSSLKGLKKFAGFMPELPWGSGLLYGGGDVQIRSDVRIYPLTKIHDMLAALA